MEAAAAGAAMQSFQYGHQPQPPVIVGAATVAMAQPSPPAPLPNPHQIQHQPLIMQMNPSPSGPSSNGSASNNVALKDVIRLIRLNLISVPSGFTKQGYPILYFPDLSANNGRVLNSVLESDLHLLFKYYLSVVPRTEQTAGFALIIDRRSSHVDGWSSFRVVIRRALSLFPARIREAYLIYPDPSNRGKEAAAALVDDFLLDFDVYHVSDPSELASRIEPKCLPLELGGRLVNDVEEWSSLQEHVEGFSFNARRIARKLAHFVGLLNQEDPNSYRGGSDAIREVAVKNRGNYRKLRKELEELTDHGLSMLKSLQRPDSNVMQRLAVQVLCKQLDQAWTYFNRSWKMQDRVYVQFVEVAAFQNAYRELASEFVDYEKIVKDLPSAGGSKEEINANLDKVDSAAQGARVIAKAKELAKAGAQLVSDHPFASDFVTPKCSELKIACHKLEMGLAEKRRVLHKFLDLMECLEAVNKWCVTATQHLQEQESKSSQQQSQSNGDENVLSKIRQIDYLLSKSRELRLKSRSDFEDKFEEIKTQMAAQTFFAVDDAVEHFEAVSYKVLEFREELRAKAVRCERKISSTYTVASSATSNKNPSLSGSESPKNNPAMECNELLNGILDSSVEIPEENEPMRIRRENILSELISTELKYVQDLEEILLFYRDRLSNSPEITIREKSTVIFANLTEIHHFHSNILEPELARSGLNPGNIARIFLANRHDIKLLYSSYCQNMSRATAAIEELGGEQSPNSIFVVCQKEAGHPLPLSSYLLKPMQRLTKYQLLLKDLTTSSNVVCGKTDLEEALSELLSVIKVVNDSMHRVTVKGLPDAVTPLGALNAREAFQVTTEPRPTGGATTPGHTLISQTSSSNMFSRNKTQRRNLFLYDNHLIFCKIISEKSQTYQFKMSLSTSSLGMSSVVKSDEKKLEVWVHGRNEVFVLEAKNKKNKEEFASELRKLINRQKEYRNSGLSNGSSGSSTSGSSVSFGRNFYNTMHLQPNQNQSVFFYNTDANSSSSNNAEAAPEMASILKQKQSRLSRSRSLESSRATARLRSRSLDCAGDRSSPEEEDEDLIDLKSNGVENSSKSPNFSKVGNSTGKLEGGRYVVLADYMALTNREIDLTEEEVVELVKVGCAGWWYVRLTGYPYSEGWAPSTYLEKIL